MVKNSIGIDFQKKNVFINATLIVSRYYPKNCAIYAADYILAAPKLPGPNRGTAPHLH